MITRLIKLPRRKSFFLFGPRGSGKSTLLKQLFSTETTLFIDLLDPEEENRFALKPSELEAIILALPKKIIRIVIDEIQKIPKLLDVVHLLIEKTNKTFILTGSSARKLKYGGSNLLAGRAFVYNLQPFSFLEIGKEFDLSMALQYGTLPRVFTLLKNEKSKFLQAYAITYLKEEIWGEHLIRKLDPFRKFLEVAAQCNGKILNYANISRDVGVDDKTIKEYFTLLEDTLIGFFLEPYVGSFRKRLSLKPKFYFFDCGVTKALTRTLSLPLREGTSAYGETFEHFVILECVKLAGYFKPEYRFSYLYTKDGVEVDLVVERPGLPHLLIEIKSATDVSKEHLRQFIKISQDFKNCKAVCFSNAKYAAKHSNVTVLPWQEGVKKYFI